MELFCLFKLKWIIKYKKRYKITKSTKGALLNVQWLSSGFNQVRWGTCIYKRDWKFI